MKSQCISIFDGYICINFFERKPAVITEGKLHFISVKIRFSTTQNRSYFWQFNFANTFQIIYDFFFFEIKLLFVIHMLPLTSSTSTKMLTFRFYSVLGVFVELYRFSFVIAFSFFESLNIYHIAGNGIR